MQFSSLIAQNGVTQRDSEGINNIYKQYDWQRRDFIVSVYLSTARGSQGLLMLTDNFKKLIYIYIYYMIVYIYIYYMIVCIYTVGLYLSISFIFNV